MGCGHAAMFDDLATEAAAASRNNRIPELSSRTGKPSP